MRVRIVGQNSSEVADDLRAGVLEAAVIALPVDDTGLDVRPVMRWRSSTPPGSPACPSG